MKQLETYFRQYILNVRHLKSTSADHYAQALRTVSRYLRNAGEITGDIYGVDQLSDLYRLKTVLAGIPTFVKLDDDGNRMYTAGLNRYIEFAEMKQSSKSKSPAAITLMDVPVERPTRRPHVCYGWNRGRVIVEQVLKADNFQCEISQAHKTFTTRKNETPYLEGHHLIPISKQDKFAASLDVYANIIGLCPNCHRQLHYGKKSEVRAILSGLYDLRVSRLVQSDIRLSKDEFIALAV